MNTEEYGSLAEDSRPTRNDPFTQLVVDEAYGRAPEGTAERLAADPHRWRAALVDLNADAMEQQSRMNAAWEDFKTIRRDPVEMSGFRADYMERKSRVGHFQKKIQRRMRHVALLIREQGQQEQANAGTHRWRKLCLWVLADYDDEEWDNLEELVPAELAETLEFARRLTDEGAGPTLAPASTGATAAPHIPQFAGPHITGEGEQQ